jgi:hypothetical protein
MEKQKEEVEVGKRRRKGRRLLIYKIYCKEFHFKTKAYCCINELRIFL